MTIIIRNLGLFIILFFSNFNHSFAQDNPWQIATFRSDITNQSQVFSLPNEYKSFQLDLNVIENQIGKKSNTKKGKNIEISIPNPEGVFEVFIIKENSVVASEVAHLYDIKTYSGYKKNQPTVRIQCDFGVHGFHAAVLASHNTYMIEPILKNDKSLYKSYYKKNSRSNHSTFCKAEQMKSIAQNNSTQRRNGATQLRTFRLALVSAGEFSQEYGGSPYNSANVLAALATVTNLANGIYKRDLAIEFILVSTTDIIFENPATDDYTPASSNAMLTQCQDDCDDHIGHANYDLGHVLVHGNFGGVAVSAGCIPNFKARGFSSDFRGLTILATDYFCHEVGHQLGANHTFVSQECGTSVNNIRYEPGEGSSIMAYAGVCGGAASYQNQSDPFFHSASIDEITTYMNAAGNCYASSSPGTGNNADPVASGGADLTIPTQTAFVLVGSATDANDASSQLTYIWEQFDGSGTAVNGTPDCNSTTHPLFRFYPPTDMSQVRSFPAFSDILAGQNNNVAWEKLSCAARNMNFRMVVRDNNTDWGRTSIDDVVVTVANTGPFDVTAPNGGENFSSSTETVTWTVNNTDSHCPNVDVLISTDSGQTWTVLANNVTNNGSATVTLPNTDSNTARMLVQCHTDNAQFREASTFFDVSDANFAFSNAGGEPIVTSDVYLTQSVNVDSAGIGDTIIFTIRLFNELNTDLTNVQVTDILPTGLTMASHTTSVGTTYDGTIWDIGTIASSVDSLELVIYAEITSKGTFSNVAELTQMTETDRDSSPNNQNFQEDDIAMSCVRTVIPLCTMSNDTVFIEASAGLTDYQWYKDGTPISAANGGTDSIYQATMGGIYTWDASFEDCPTADCCAVEIEEITFDLVTQDTTVCLGLSVDLADLVVDNNQVSGTFSFYQNLADAENETNPLNDSIVSPMMTTEYYIRKNSAGSHCFVLDSLTVIISEILVNVSTACFNNHTEGINSDDTFSVFVAAINDLAGVSNKYLVIYDGNVLNTGGTNYNTTTALNHPDFVADGVFSPVLTIRDFDDATCEKMITVPATTSCSVCLSSNCLPIKFNRKLRD